jgi:endonuclease III
VTSQRKNIFQGSLLYYNMDVITQLLHLHGKLYSTNLGINPREEPFKWLLASVLYGAPIREKTAAKTYRVFEAHKVTTPERILEVGWHELVDILDEGGYTRYDYKTADKLLEMAQSVREEGIPYTREGIISLARGIGDTTATIFLRELRNNHIAPEPQEPVYDAAENLGLLQERTLHSLKKVWAESRVEPYTFINFEVALLKLGKNYCRKGKHDQCGMTEWCRVMD